MNEYTEALYTLTDWFHGYHDSVGRMVHEQYIDDRYEKAKKKIQSLIDRADSVTDYAEYLDGQMGMYIRSLEEANEKINHLEKALDIACETVAEFDKALNDEYGGGCEGKDKWKKWCLKEAKKK